MWVDEIVNPSPRPRFAISEPAEAAYVRSPVTALRFAGAMVVVGLMYVALQAADPARFATNVGDLLGSAPHWMVAVVVSTCQIGFLVPAMLGIVSQLVLRRFARVVRMLLASVVCAGGLVAMSKLVGASVLPLLPPKPTGPARSPAVSSTV